MTGFSSSLRTGRRALLDFLFPPRCAGCGRRGEWLCAACLTHVRFLGPPWCERCGDPLPGGGRCAGCRSGGPFALDWARAACAFGGPVREAIHRFKYGGERARRDHLARFLCDWPARPAVAADSLLVPVPLDSARRRARGYNQAEELAGVLAREWGRPLSTDLARTRRTRPQVGLDRRARRENVRGAFAWRGASLAGRPIVLVDDVMTTGATAEACAVALKAAGAASVGLLAVARPVGEAYLRDPPQDA